LRFERKELKPIQIWAGSTLSGDLASFQVKLQDQEIQLPKGTAVSVDEELGHQCMANARAIVLAFESGPLLRSLHDGSN
jgi:hypothetical protein